ncbi:autophagy-related protein 22-like protein [Lyophyllum atratum]|nr:autophagy-related protein 22-like protein [Lyophyllum atratum]
MLSATDSAAYNKKLRGWLSYAFASEVFVIVSLTLFLPICLEQFARDNGYLLPDRTEPCSSVAKSIQRGEESLNIPPAARCVVKIGWAWVDSASFSLYVYSISVALQALTVISMGGIADHPPHRKRLLFFFALLGASAATTFLILPSTSPLWFLAAPLAVLANVGFGASVVAMNAYLPAFAKESPEVRAIQDEIQNKADTPSTPPTPTNQEAYDRVLSLDPSSPLIHRSPSEELKAKYDSELSRVMSRISSLGIALGYGAGILLLVIALIPVTMLHGSTFALRLAIGLSGIWWAAFSVPAALWLPDSESPRMNGASAWDGAGAETWEGGSGFGEWSTKREIVLAWKRLGSMLRWGEMKKLSNTFKYLGAWFLLSDGFTTITSTAILFGKTTLNMQPPALILVGILTPTSGILGSLAWPFLQRRYGWTNLKVIVILVMMASAIPAYGCLGFLGVFQGDEGRFGGLTRQGEMFGLAVYFGSVYGAFQGYARAFYAELLPPGEEARWYGLFSITDKSSSFIGPLIVGVIADTTGNIRYAFFFLVGMIWMAIPVLVSVDVERGRKDARGYRYTVT